MTFTQSDGSRLTVTLHGDEDFSWWQAQDGTLLVQRGHDFFVANVQADGSLKATSLLAHEPNLRTEREQQMVSWQNRQLFLQGVEAVRRQQALRRESLAAGSPTYFPHTGSPTVLVILINFADTTFSVTDPVATFDQYLNGDVQEDLGHGESLNYGSVKKYFADMSFGQFTPQFDVHGPVTLSQPMAWYGADNGSVKDVHCLDMVREALTAAGDDIDFTDSKYDSNGDGVIDLVYIVYAGFGQSTGGDDNTIWPKCGSASLGTYGGKTVRRYGVSPELNMRWGAFKDSQGNPVKYVNGVGLFCHEFSHALGLPDLYPTTSAAYVNNQEMEYWSLMDGGEYVYYGYYPTAYTAWERETMGWMTIDTLASDRHVSLQPVNNGGKAYKYYNPNDTLGRECMMMENIQKTGWNRYALGHGLLVYHSNWAAATVNVYDHPNNVAGKPRMAVVPADGLLISSYLVGGSYPYTVSQYRKSHAGDPFPGDSSVTRLSYLLRLPNYVWHEGNDSIVRQVVNNISEDTSTGTVSFDFVEDYATPISVVSKEESAHADARIYTLDGRYVGTRKDRLPSGIYIVGRRKTVIP